MRFIYFSQVRELIGQSEETLSVPDEVRTLGALTEWMNERGGGYAQAMAIENLCFAINQEFATRGDTLEGAREVGFFPPVSGG